MITELTKKLNESSKAIQNKTSIQPKVGITLGSGLGDFADVIKDKKEISYHEIPHFQKTTVTGHTGKLVLGKINDTEVACLQGRIHCYEGHTPQEVVFPTRVLKKLGCSYLLLTNASGGINPQYCPGDLVMITDHINLTGKNPLEGPNEEDLGPRFPDMGHIYHPDIQEALQEAAFKSNYQLKQGVYAGVLGPSYETPAEVKMLSVLGADLVGMSTIFEAIAAHHNGLKIGAISCVTNMATGIEKRELRHEDIKNQALKAKQAFHQLIVNTISQLK